MGQEVGRIQLGDLGPSLALVPQHWCSLGNISVAQLKVARQVLAPLSTSGVLSMALTTASVSPLVMWGQLPPRKREDERWSCIRT